SVAWEPERKRLATGSTDERVKIWNATTGLPEVTLRGHRQSINSLAWGPSGRLASTCAFGRMRIWTPVRDQQARVSAGHSAAWNPRGDRLASGGGSDDGHGDNLAKVWDPIRGAEHARSQAHGGPVYRVAWSPDGKRLASISTDSLVMTWDAETGRKLATMRGHNDYGTGVVWSPEGKRLASAGLDNS